MDNFSNLSLGVVPFFPVIVHTRLHIFYLFLFFFKILCVFIERGKEGGREGEKHQCVVASHVPPTEDVVPQCRHVP